jgi:hypothetical protein
MAMKIGDRLAGDVPKALAVNDERLGWLRQMLLAGPGSYPRWRCVGWKSHENVPMAARLAEKPQDRPRTQPAEVGGAVTFASRGAS